MVKLPTPKQNCRNSIFFLFKIWDKSTSIMFDFVFQGSVPLILFRGMNSEFTCTQKYPNSLIWFTQKWFADFSESLGVKSQGSRQCGYSDLFFTALVKVTLPLGFTLFISPLLLRVILNRKKYQVQVYLFTMSKFKVVEENSFC